MTVRYIQHRTNQDLARASSSILVPTAAILLDSTTDRGL